MKENDSVNSPQHYTSHPSGVECIQIVEHMGLNLGNAFKYMFRRNHKGNAVQDLRKALWYVDREIQRISGSHEEWVDYPGNPKLKVSSLGRVRGPKGDRTPVTLKSGYQTIMMVESGKSVCRYVHRMVAESFIGEIAEGFVVCHLDGDKSNNAVWNLMIASQEENLSHRRIHDTHFVGGSNPMSVLSARQVEIIRSQRGSRLADAVAEEFGVTHMTVRRIWSGQSWAKPETPFTRLLSMIVDHEPDRGVAEVLSCVAMARFSKTAASDLIGASNQIGEIIARMEAAK